MELNVPATSLPRIVVIGAGFGGLELVKKLVKLPVQVVLFDYKNYHTFQPLLYQVATGGLEPDSIAYPVRRVFKNKENFFFRVAEVQQVQVQQKRIETSIGSLAFDYLVIASGSKPNYFNFENVQDYFMTLKNVPDALNLRSLILQNLEKALLTDDLNRKKGLMNIVIVGAGPTGVELAGALGEMKNHIFPKDYPELDLSMMEIHVFEMADMVLPGMSSKSSESAEKFLQKFGVQVHLGAKVVDYNGNNVEVEGREPIPTDTFVWTAGVQGATINGLHPENIGKANRILVNRYNKVIGFEDVFAIGDVALMKTEKYQEGHPMVAPVAIQQADLLGENFKRMLHQEELKKFEYKDKGSLATVGRNKAVADLPNAHFRGFIAWVLWMVVHIMQLIGFRNKVVTLIGWIWNYFTYDRALRLIIRPYRKPKPYLKTEEL